MDNRESDHFFALYRFLLVNAHGLSGMQLEVMLCYNLAVNGDLSPGEHGFDGIASAVCNRLK
ncbi:hypothetical protein D3C72_1958370 [compost metagenome]